MLGTNGQMKIMVLVMIGKLKPRFWNLLRLTNAFYARLCELRHNMKNLNHKTKRIVGWWTTSRVYGFGQFCRSCRCSAHQLRDLKFACPATAICRLVKQYLVVKKFAGDAGNQWPDEINYGTHDDWKAEATLLKLTAIDVGWWTTSRVYGFGQFCRSCRCSAHQLRDLKFACPATAICRLVKQYLVVKKFAGDAGNQWPDEINYGTHDDWKAEATLLKLTAIDKCFLCKIVRAKA